MTPRVLYHVSEPPARSSILTQGLDPAYDETGFGGIFLSVTPILQEETPELDQWRVYTDGLNIEPDLSTPGFEDEWFMTTDKIDPGRLELMDSFELEDRAAAVDEEDWENYDDSEDEEKLREMLDEEENRPPPKFYEGDAVREEGYGISGKIQGEPYWYNGRWIYYVYMYDQDGPRGIEVWPEDDLVRPNRYDQPGELTLKDLFGITPGAGEEYYRTAPKDASTSRDPHQCPYCGSTNILFPSLHNDWRCEDCGEHWQPGDEEHTMTPTETLDGMWEAASDPNGGDLGFQVGDRVELPHDGGEGTVIEVEEPQEEEDGTFTNWVRVRKDDGQVVVAADWMLRFVQGLDGAMMPDTIDWPEDEQDYYRQAANIFDWEDDEWKDDAEAMGAPKPPDDPEEKPKPRFVPGNMVEVKNNSTGQMMSGMVLHGPEWNRHAQDWGYAVAWDYGGLGTIGEKDLYPGLERFPKPMDVHILKMWPDKLPWSEEEQEYYRTSSDDEIERDWTKGWMAGDIYRLPAYDDDGDRTNFTYYMIDNISGDEITLVRTNVVGEPIDKNPRVESMVFAEDFPAWLKQYDAELQGHVPVPMTRSEIDPEALDLLWPDTLPWPEDEQNYYRDAKTAGAIPLYNHAEYDIFLPSGEQRRAVYHGLAFPGTFEKPKMYYDPGDEATFDHLFYDFEHSEYIRFTQDELDEAMDEGRIFLDDSTRIMKSVNEWLDEKYGPSTPNFAPESRTAQDHYQFAIGDTVQLTNAELAKSPKMHGVHGEIIDFEDNDIRVKWYHPVDPGFETLEGEETLEPYQVLTEEKADELWPDFYYFPETSSWTSRPTSAILQRMAQSTDRLRSALDSDPAAGAAYDALTAAGGTVYIVGGAVRDSVLDKSSKDVDLMVSGLAPEMIEATLSSLGRVDLTGKAFGVFRFKRDGGEVEIALPRTERSTGSGHKDFEVTYDPNIPVETDLERRDFTGNAMAYDPASNQIIDPYGGTDDLTNNRLRLVNPNAFVDDPLRIVRALVAQARFGLEPDPALVESMRQNGARIRHLPGDRIKDELDKLFKAPNPVVAMQAAEDSGLLEYLAPELSAAVGFDQMNPHHDLDVWQHTMQVLNKMTSLSNDPDLRLAALFHDSGKPNSFWRDETAPEGGGGHFYQKQLEDGSTVGLNHEEEGERLAREFMTRLRYPNKRIDRVTKLIRNHMFPYFNSKKGARRFLASVDGDVKTAFDLLLLREADSSGKNGGEQSEFDATSVNKARDLLQQVIDEGDADEMANPAINGHDLMQLGIKPGPEMGKILNKIKDMIVDDPSLNEKDTLLELVRQGI
jgi:tRNA nucleotidyltransferase (CCA-adding enzyme)